ncbi:MAG: hypothetical protein WC533_03660 [Candidatus Pacearchaeota archaeon]
MRHIINNIFLQKDVNYKFREPFLKRVYRVIRRSFFINFRKGYIEKQLRNRKGKCLACGCCGIVGVKCQYFNKETNLCELWLKGGKTAIPKHCQTYPFDEKDKVLYSKLNCGFYWDD